MRSSIVLFVEVYVVMTLYFCIPDASFAQGYFDGKQQKSTQIKLGGRKLVEKV